MRVRKGWARSRTTRSTLIWEIPVKISDPDCTVLWEGPPDLPEK
jgi:hypothetical protein